MIITIDTEKETTPASYARLKGIRTNVVSNWIARGRIKCRKIPELNLTLVEIDSHITPEPRPIKDKLIAP